MSLFSNAVIGQYYPGDSLVHRLDPRAKLLAIPLMVAATMLADNPTGYLVAAVPVLLLTVLAQIPPRVLWQGMKFLWVILLISLVLQVMSYPGESLWQWGIISISREGLAAAGKLMYRLILLILAAMLLTMTTTPVNLTGGLEKLLQPFKRIGLPAHELAMMMTIALRFVPTLLQEAEIVRQAQQARGGSLTTGNLQQRMRAAVALMVPLLAGSLKRADELAVAMEARCYRGDYRRTKMRQFKFSGHDYMAIIISAAALLVVLWERWT
ncbi:energy-coupling factor transporter transmembrane component T family protein [Desulfotomaculum nigrificans]|uniref:energy-coupling factor transporter transmembrane component T family protein n=1 Tax=Desulfotomaculum nigrificans TaxID=1565 RepID=UPI0001FAE8E5|nr:energy-coupling factor transporter transmembrane component T [Desulfotomaculum nigrificans]